MAMVIPHHHADQLLIDDGLLLENQEHMQDSMLRIHASPLVYEANTGTAALIRHGFICNRDLERMYSGKNVISRSYLDLYDRNYNGITSYMKDKKSSIQS